MECVNKEIIIIKIIKIIIIIIKGTQTAVEKLNSFLLIFFNHDSPQLTENKLLKTNRIS